ncbi:ADCYA cyclase, partial [Anseranas semipalmata]|nr:ADCYA cyclase [Anseranas semipalmata]
GEVPVARVRSFRRLPSHKPIFLSMPAGRLLLSLQLGAAQRDSALGRAFTFPSLSPGDAVLVLWRTSAPRMHKTISLVLQCCQQIQKKHGSRDTHVGLTLHLKIGISAGSMTFLTVGDRNRQYFFICSKALDEVTEAQNLARKSEVIVSPTCWELCEQQRIYTKQLGGERALKVTGMEHMPGSECQDAVCQLDQCTEMWHLEGAGLRRPALLSSDPEVAAMLRKHLPAVVLRKLNQDVPLDLCSELRPVTTLFVQLHFAAEANLLDLSRNLCDASRMISEILSPHMGEINKALLFDKGCTFLCLFGLSGAKLHSESIHALESALQIFNACSTWLSKLE